MLLSYYAEVFLINALEIKLNKITIEPANNLVSGGHEDSNHDLGCRRPFADIILSAVRIVEIIAKCFYNLREMFTK